MNGGLREEQTRESVDLGGSTGLGGIDELELAAGNAGADDTVSERTVAADRVSSTRVSAASAGANSTSDVDESDELDVEDEDEQSGDEHRNTLSSYLLYFAWVVSVIATLGSLYFSEIRGFIPCELCWYQRILMYPLSVILGIAAYNNDLRIKKYILPLSIIGICVSLYHYLLQKVPGFALAKPCVQGVPCDMMYINWFGFITIPFLALVAFSLITISLLAIRKRG